MSAVEKIFEEAASDFAQRLSQKELDTFNRTTYAHVKQEILKIQHDGETFKNMRNLNRLRSFLEAMEQYSKVIEVFLNVNQFVGLVWGPLKFLLQVRSPGSLFSPSAVSPSCLPIGPQERCIVPVSLTISLTILPQRLLAHSSTRSTACSTPMSGSARNCRCSSNTANCSGKNQT